jgi:hypothetical protein
MMNRSVDLSGLTYGVAMAIVAADLDRGIADALAILQREYAQQGAGADEIATMIDFQRDDLEAWREEVLSRMRVWLIEGGGSRLH